MLSLTAIVVPFKGDSIDTEAAQANFKADLCTRVGIEKSDELSSYDQPVVRDLSHTNHH